ncbi:hypothetical protein EC957_006637 [Mortierella hygrophila]|uniref:Adhesin domain-containing protein n=1 Tax=Mortierella hygrophila TaxID=979708 RepID=A0A9P6FDN6_9FUNG|nr:hypothetical protein EC957_006637 [Mortierella hygrophila]
MGLFNKPLLPAHFENEDVQISAELCSNIAINVVGLAKGEITILSGNEDVIQIRTSIQAKESILKNAAALEPVQDGNQYTYTIHTPLEAKLERSVTFQVFVTIPRHLDSLESFAVQGTNIELSIGNISHTFIKNLSVVNAKGDVTIESFYGEIATIKNTISGGIQGKYSVARLFATAKSGKITSKVHLLNTDEKQPAPKVICATLHHPVSVDVDGTDLFGPFTVEAKTQCQPLDIKILLANKEQRLLGNFINFGGPTRIKMSGNYQGRIETRTHYGKIVIDEPEFEILEGATLSVPSLSDRYHTHNQQQSMPNLTTSAASISSSGSSTHHQSTAMSSRTSSQGSTTAPSTPTKSNPATWDRDDPRHQQSYLNHPHNGSQYPNHHHHHSPPASGTNSRDGSLHGSFSETRSVHTVKSSSDLGKKDKESVNTREVIGVIGHGNGLVMCKNQSGDIHISLI